MSNSPCRKECPNRSPTCHVSCKKYRRWQQEHNRELQERQKHRETEYAFIEMSQRWGNRRNG